MELILDEIVARSALATDAEAEKDGLVQLLGSDGNGELGGESLCRLGNKSEMGLIIGCAQDWQELNGSVLDASKASSFKLCES